MVVVGEDLNCPCGSQVKYLACCGLYIENTCHAPSPETLMRSRYTAYSLAKIDYIKKTMFGRPLNGFNDAEAKHWATSTVWIGLRIINAPTASADIGYVEFIAHFMEGGQIKFIHETSEFNCHQGIWFYVDGIQKKINTISVPRNTPCPCGSHKKFKNCHAKET